MQIMSTCTSNACIRKNIGYDLYGEVTTMSREQAGLFSKEAS